MRDDLIWQHLEEFRRGFASVRFFRHVCDFVPVGWKVEIDPDPTTDADIRWTEELGRIAGDEDLLDSGRSRQPYRQTVTVVMIGKRGEASSFGHEPARFAVAEALGCFRQRHADASHLIEDGLTHD